jgi:hypothetical protein
MADTDAQRRAKTAYRQRQRAADPEGFKLRAREAQKRYNEIHKERRAAARKAKREANLEAERARGRVEYARNTEARKAAAKRWKDANRERVIEYRRHANLKRYGLTPDEKAAMLLAQGNSCAVCKSPNPGTTRGWQVDHCHATGKTRAILCLPCNVALGKAKDSPETLRALADYVEKHRG